ncbi:MAG: hypothetical protein DRJ50_06895 [Actinobacteria bacterium]|nr:MAG: hypothetical protein DRJ50_06895 [Actinomycetota bacterium]
MTITRVANGGRSAQRRRVENGVSAGRPMKSEPLAHLDKPVSGGVARALVISSGCCTEIVIPTADDVTRRQRYGRSVLDGQPNFRDLGGLRTVDGSLVLTGEIYRSGDLSALTDSDLSRLEDLGIRTVVDLRSDGEVDLQPDRLPSSATYHRLPILPGGAGSTADRFFETFDPADLPPWDDIYRSLIREESETLGSLIRMTSDPHERPLVFHCSAGKDRTGVAAALLLALLGVPWSAVEEDFLRSNAILGADRDRIMERWTSMFEGQNANPGADVDIGGNADHFLTVDSSYLDAARDEMIKRDGSVSTYTRRSLGITGNVRAMLRSQLLD